MRAKINKHPYLVAVFCVVFVLAAMFGADVLAGIKDRFSKIDLEQAPHNYIRFPDVDARSNFYKDSETAPDGEVWLGNLGGSLSIKGELPYPIGEKTVLIDDIDDLQLLSGITTEPTDSGASIFWLEWGNHYLVDPWAIAVSGLTYPSTGTTQITIFSAVSGYLRQVMEEDDEKTITIEYYESGDSGYWNSTLSETTPVYVFMPLNSACTRYSCYDVPVSGVTSTDSGTTWQSMLITWPKSTFPGGNTVFGVHPTLDTFAGSGYYGFSGASYWQLDQVGERVTFKANYGAGISVYPVFERLYGLSSGN